MNWLEKLAKKGIKYDYSSVQFDFPTEIATKVKKWGEKHISDSDLYIEGDKYAREDDIHTTVKYGLVTASVEPIKNKIKDIKPFYITLGKISRFVPSDEEYDVVKIEYNGDGLFKLNKILCELKNEDSHPEYKPHCTIAYVKKGHCSELSGNGELEGIRVKVDEVTFSSKTGEKSKIKF